jgi:hypothetical protein
MQHLFSRSMNDIRTTYIATALDTTKSSAGGIGNYVGFDDLGKRST